MLIYEIVLPHRTKTEEGTIEWRDKHDELKFNSQNSLFITTLRVMLYSCWLILPLYFNSANCKWLCNIGWWFPWKWLGSLNLILKALRKYIRLQITFYSSSAYELFVQCKSMLFKKNRSTIIMINWEFIPPWMFFCKVQLDANVI